MQVLGFIDRSAGESLPALLGAKAEMRRGQAAVTMLAKNDCIPASLPPLKRSKKECPLVQICYDDYPAWR
jgi:hypothetical protein